ncbi:MAG: Integrase, catalytic region, partial [uncultured Thermomicrobiales bacterium]
ARERGDALPQRGAPRLAPSGARRRPRRAPARRARRPGGHAGGLGGVASGTRPPVHPAGGVAAVATAAGLGQPRRPQDARSRPLALRARRHAALHPARRVVAEHGRVDPAHPEAPRPGGDPPGKPAGHHRRAGGDGARLEPRPHPVRLGRPARRAAGPRPPAPPRPRRLGGTGPPPHPAALSTGRTMAI